MTRLDEHFDVQAHRGGMGLTVENTLAGFATALDVGVSTIECDVHLTRDEVPVLVHDSVVGPALVREGADPGDGVWPYVGRTVLDLTLAQLRTLDVGSVRHPEHPEQRLVPGARVPTLQELFDLLDERGAEHVGVNLELKYDPTTPHLAPEHARLAEVVCETIGRAGMGGRVSFQSFDWALLRLVHELDPDVTTYALFSPRYLMVGQPGASPWLGGLDVDDHEGNGVAAASALGFDGVSPIHGSPYRTGVEDPAYVAFATAELIEQAHEEGLLVVPYVVDDVATMRRLVLDGADGLITNHPERLREVLVDLGEPVPVPCPAPARPLPDPGS